MKLVEMVYVSIVALYCLQSCTPPPKRSVYFVNFSGLNVQLTRADVKTRLGNGDELLVNSDSQKAPTVFDIQIEKERTTVRIPEAWNLDPRNEKLEHVMYFSPGRNKIVLMPDKKIYVWPRFVGGGNPEVVKEDDLSKYTDYQPIGFPFPVSSKEK